MNSPSSELHTDGPLPPLSHQQRRRSRRVYLQLKPTYSYAVLWRITYIESGGIAPPDFVDCRIDRNQSPLSLTDDLSPIVQLNIELSHVSSPGKVHPYHFSERLPILMLAPWIHLRAWDSTSLETAKGTGNIHREINVSGSKIRHDTVDRRSVPPAAYRSDSPRARIMELSARLFIGSSGRR